MKNGLWEGSIWWDAHQELHGTPEHDFFMKLVDKENERLKEILKSRTNHLTKPKGEGK